MFGWGVNMREPQIYNKKHFKKKITLSRGGGRFSTGGGGFFPLFPLGVLYKYHCMGVEH